MPEGDTLARIAVVLDRALTGQEVSAARGRPGGARLDLVVGTTVESVEARGKHLLIGFSNGMTLHTHLALHGQWHRYRPGERWRRSPSRAVAVIETPSIGRGLLRRSDRRAARHTCTGVAPGPQPAWTRHGEGGLRPRRSRRGAAPAKPSGHHDRRCAARPASALPALGNVYRSELCFLERLDPFTSVAHVGDAVLRGCWSAVPR